MTHHRLRMQAECFVEMSCLNHILLQYFCVIEQVRFIPCHVHQFVLYGVCLYHVMFISVSCMVCVYTMSCSSICLVYCVFIPCHVHQCVLYGVCLYHVMFSSVLYGVCLYHVMFISVSCVCLYHAMFISVSCMVCVYTMSCSSVCLVYCVFIPCHVHQCVLYGVCLYHAMFINISHTMCLYHAILVLPGLDHRP